MSGSARKIVLLEDDPRPANRVHRTLLEEFPGSVVTRIRTESGFRSKVSEFSKDKPDVIILDVMLPWTDREHMAPLPDEVPDDYHRAGFRCIKFLAESDGTQGIPCIIYTVLARSALDKEFEELPSALVVEYLQKQSDHIGLLNLIRRLTRHRRRR